MNVVVHLGCLTGLAGAEPGSDIPGEVWPHIPGGGEAPTGG